LELGPTCKAAFEKEKSLVDLLDGLGTLGERKRE